MEHPGSPGNYPSTAHFMNPEAVRKYEFINALRGIAIIGVVMIHSSQWVQPTSKVLSKITELGVYGVQLFYVVSALTLFLSMDVRKRSEASPTRNFFIRRFFRIAPLFYLAILLYVLIDGFGPRYWAPNGIHWWYILLTAIFLNGWHPETINSVVPGGWSIAIEMTFYALVPILHLKLKDINSSIRFVIITLILTNILSPIILKALMSNYPFDQIYLASNFIFLWFFSQLPIFGLGILTYHIFNQHQDRKDERLGTTLLALSLFLFVSFWSASSYRNFLPQHFLYSGVFCIFALSLHFYPYKVFVNPIVDWIGKLSFSIYLIHFAVLKLMKILFIKNLLPSGELGFIVAFIVVMLVSIGISTLTYWAVEQPGIRLGRYIIRKLESMA